MQLAPLQALCPLVAVGVTGWTLGAALPERPRHRVRTVGAALVVASLVVAGLWLAFVGMGRLIETHPALAPVVLVAAMLVLLLIPLLRSGRGAGRTASAAARGEDDDGPGGGGGGLRVPRPVDPEGRGPAGPSVPWDEFDEIRSGWDRVPAGRR